MSRVHGICDGVIHAGLMALVVFTPLAFGTVEPWSLAITEWGVVTLLLVYALSRLYPGARTPAASPQVGRPPFLGLALPLGLFLALALAQLVPLPMRWLRAASPGSARLYESVDFSSWEHAEEGTDEVRGNRNDPVLALHASERRSVSVNPDATVARILLLASLAGLFLMVARWADEQRAVSILRFIVFVAFLVSLFGLVQLFTWNGKIYWVRNVPSRYADPPSAFGPFVNRDHFAGYVEMVIPVALCLVFWLVDARRRVRKMPPGSGTGGGPRTELLDGLVDDRRSMSKALLALFFAVILIVSLFFSLSRAGILSAFLSGTVLLVLLCRRVASKLLRWSMTLALPVVVVALIAFIGAETVKKQLQTYSNFSGEDSVRVRVVVWKRIVRELPAYAWFGSGLGTFEDSFASVTTPGSAKRWDRAHNDYLQLVWETGLTGGLLFLSGAAIFVLRYWWPALRDFKSPIDVFRIGIAVSLLSIALHSAVDFCLQLGANGFLCALLGGLLVALTPRAARGDAVGNKVHPIEAHRAN